MIRLFASVTAAVFIAVPPAFSAQVPVPGPIDHRVREVDYNAHEVYTLTAFFGYHITIVFARGENVIKAAAGFADAWDVNNHGSFITVKPKDPGPETSLVVTTDRRMYAFDLRSKAPAKVVHAAAYAADPEQIFVLRFRYPDDERAAAEAARAQVELSRQLAAARAQEERQRLEALARIPKKPNNRSYLYEGVDAIAPYEAWDDGTFTYLRFYAQQDLPAVFVVNEDDTESVANKHFDKDVMVIQRVARQFRLRKGQSVVCIYNDNPEYRTAQPTSGATDPGAERQTKGR